jgi:hypothetical protein
MEVSQFEKNFPFGARALIHCVQYTARLKSCPFKARINMCGNTSVFVENLPSLIGRYVQLTRFRLEFHCDSALFSAGAEH